jgi:hypothetical protein
MDEVSKREEKAYAAGAVATENYVAQCRAEDKPLTMQGLKAAVRKEVFATVGEPPKRAREAPLIGNITPVQPIGDAWLDFTSAVKQVATVPADLQSLADRTPAALRARLLDEARGAAIRLSDWIAALEAQHV